MGDCCSISEAVEFTLSLKEEGEVIQGTFYNRDMKDFLLSHYGDQITIAPNTKTSKSDILFSSTIIATNIAVKLKNQDIYTECGKGMREDLKKSRFWIRS